MYDCCLLAKSKCSQDSQQHESRRSIYRKEMSVDHLQIFGCPVCIHIPEDKRKNLDCTSLKGIFVGVE